MFDFGHYNQHDMPISSAQKHRKLRHEHNSESSTYRRYNFPKKSSFDKSERTGMRLRLGMTHRGWRMTDMNKNE